jgi:hypothetical protein
MMRYVRFASRMILGVVFIFSGFVKAVDPLGSAYKFSDYFSAFRLDFLDVISLPLGIGLSAFELVLGITLILGYRRKVISRVVMWFMLFFTLLTLVLALFNPVSDCGCFGDALILTNWQTFLKNVVLMIFVLMLFLGRNQETATGNAVREWMMVLFIYLTVCLFGLWNFRHLPLLDFRPYDVGTVIAEEMEIPEGAPVDEYETTLIYRNKESGEDVEFTIDNYPGDTLLWEFVTSESKLVNKGYEPPIHDFAIMDAFGYDLVDQLLTDPGYTLLMICHDLEKADESALLRSRQWAQLDRLSGDFSFYPVTASTTEVVLETVASLDLGYDFLAADQIMLKTMVRSNPGFMLLNDGAIVSKWGYRDFPAPGALDPAITEIMESASIPDESEIRLIEEAGIYADFNLDLIEFGKLVPKLIFEQTGRKQESRAVLLFMVLVIMVGLISHLIVPVRL